MAVQLAPIQTVLIADKAEYQLTEHAEFPSPESCNSSTQSNTSPRHFRNVQDTSTMPGELRMRWENEMKDLGGMGLPHENTAVLMISWCKALDDLVTTDEVNKLSTLFEDSFNFKVMRREIEEGKRPQIQVQKYLADFVHEHDHKSTLLIVYYAGHGIPAKPGQLVLAGNRYPKERINERNSIVWHEAEPILKYAEGDVLVIFDCCYAGNLAEESTRGLHSTRAFEFLAASKARKTTAMPGPNSFTSALIISLEDLLKKRKRFTTTELESRIRKCNKHQDPFFCERAEPCERRIVLAASPSSPTSIPDSENKLYESSAQPEKIEEYLDLRFCFERPLAEDDIVQLTDGLKHLIQQKSLSVQRISWRGHHNVVRDTLDKWKKHDIARKAFRRWRNFRKNLHLQVPTSSFPHEPTSPPLSSAMSDASDYQDNHEVDLDTCNITTQVVRHEPPVAMGVQVPGEIVDNVADKIAISGHGQGPRHGHISVDVTLSQTHPTTHQEHNMRLNIPWQVLVIPVFLLVGVGHLRRAKDVRILGLGLGF